MPKEDAEPSASGLAVAANPNDAPPAENANHKESDACASASVSASASASSASTTPPPAQDDAEEAELLERMRGDAVGNTMFSSRFILKTVMKLVELQPESSLDQQLEDDLCKVWDMSVSPEVVTLLLENEAIDPIMYSLVAGCEDVRLYEILIGLLGNMCAQVECAELLTCNHGTMETLFKLTNCMDTAMLIQLMRLFQYIMAHVLSGKEQFAVDWYICFAAFENSAQNLGRILQQSVSDELLVAALKATNAVLASCALVEEENAKSTLNLKPFAKVFLVPELCDGVNSAFLRLMRDDQAKLADEEAGEENEDADVPAAQDSDEDADVGYDSCGPKITCDVEIIQTYLNICTILVQLPEAQASMDVYAPSIVSCLARILQFLQQPLQLIPLGERQEEYLEDLAHIWSRLKYFYHKEAFSNLLELWYRLKQHIDNYTGSDPEANDFEEDEEEEDDAPKEQYVENAFKLLRLLACMVIKAENSDLQEIGDEKVQLFVSALKAGKEDAIFSRALECLNDKVAKESGQA
ncbi:uncharacterized protein LOC6531557 [Drosophila yakuba]|uniref:Protein SAAL1 n=1 Tax=Drosophila yakuba TaxID=7245 RepID=B4P7C2_DROYA|nr:uncharacterized protein LOC6531557 [Drosophila yakuba]EDW92067.1 uncharacterized protein Dyak_GE11716 [Drosophila yakuba]